METAGKHYKFINSKTGNTLFYYTIDANLQDTALKQQLEVIRAEVAVSNGVYVETIYWEEVRDEQ